MCCKQPLCLFIANLLCLQYAFKIVQIIQYLFSQSSYNVCLEYGFIAIFQCHILPQKSEHSCLNLFNKISYFSVINFTSNLRLCNSQYCTAIFQTSNPNLLCISYRLPLYVYTIFQYTHSFYTRKIINKQKQKQRNYQQLHSYYFDGKTWSPAPSSFHF